MQPAGAAVGPHLARIDPSLELIRPSAAEERRLAAVIGEAAVEEHGQLELGGDPVGERERRLACGRLGLGLERDERDDVRRADARMGAIVLPEVDAL